MSGTSHHQGIRGGDIPGRTPTTRCEGSPRTPADVVLPGLVGEVALGVDWVAQPLCTAGRLVPARVTPEAL